jgi:hypothetical protein
MGTIVLDGVLSANGYQNQYEVWSSGIFLAWFAVIFVCGLIFVGWLIVLAGAFVGLLLKYLSSSAWFRQTWNTSARVPASQAMRCIILIGLLFIANCVFYVLLVIFKAPTQ